MREFTPGWCNFNGKFRNGSLGQAFMLPIVDALNKRPSRCCSSTYPTYCVDGYQQLMPVSLAKGDGRRSRCARLLRSFLLGIIPRPLATLIAVCVVLGVLAIVGVVIAKSVQQGLDNIEDYTEKLDYIINATNEYMIEVGLNQSDIDKLYILRGTLARNEFPSSASLWV